jgi:hypothetical protein
LQRSGQRCNPPSHSDIAGVNYRKSPERPLRSDEQRRTFTDSDGVYWDVREVKNPDYDRRGGACLIFESANAFRRVRNYPANWHELTERALVDLSNGQ